MGWYIALSSVHVALNLLVALTRGVGNEMSARGKLRKRFSKLASSHR